ncbi:FUSC family protein [Micromonospora sp. NPDC049559]|uniref:FUSC family protein n=1 Tax=Micromonospora sp. NPDC049559 TaxID=3155923 RepID=UPI00342D04CA
MNRTDWLRTSAGRLRRGWSPVVESTAAATVAWLIATRLLHHPQPFFAPAAALIVLGQARGQRWWRAIEVILGVAGGVLVADLVIQALGARGTWTVFTVILLTLALAVAVGASPISVVQAAVSALYLVVVAPPGGTLIPFRFVDALVGGGVALVASQLAVAREPVAPLLRELRQTFDELAEVIEEVAGALDRHDEPAALAALGRARRADAAVDRLRTAVLAAQEALRLHLRWRARRGGVRAVDVATVQVDYVVRSVRVLARAGVTLVRLPVTPPPELGTALRSLASAVCAAHEVFTAELTGGAEDDVRRQLERAETATLDAVRTGGRLLRADPPLPLVVIVGQVRNTAIDLLRAIGDDDVDALNRVDGALGLPPV